MARRRRNSRSGGKIKNWSKSGKTSWKHDNGNGRVLIRNHTAGTPQERGGVHQTGKYEAVYKSKAGFEMQLAPPRGNKRKVKKMAAEWMRKNPNPPRGELPAYAH